MKEITSEKAAEKALLRIAEIEAKVKEAEAQRDQIVNDANKTFTEFSQKLIEEEGKIVDLLRAYSDANRDDLYKDGAKSRKLTNGEIGYRKLPDSIEVSERTADLLIGLGMEKFVKIKKEPVKASLKNLGDDDLVKIDAKRIPGGEKFFAKANEVRLPAA